MGWIYFIYSTCPPIHRSMKSIIFFSSIHDVQQSRRCAACLSSKKRAPLSWLIEAWNPISVAVNRGPLRWSWVDAHIWKASTNKSKHRKFSIVELPSIFSFIKLLKTLVKMAVCKYWDLWKQHKRNILNRIIQCNPWPNFLLRVNCFQLRNICWSSRHLARSKP